MPQLFYPPTATQANSNGTPVSGAKAYFYTTGTTTPQAVYTDYALTIPAANPVIADSSGVFPAVYLSNGTLYRVKVADSADVLIKQTDNVGPDSATSLGAAGLTSANTFTATQKISNAEPRLILDETDGGANKRFWDVDINAGVFSIRTRTDADGAGKNIVSVTRGTATAITSMVYGDAADLPSHGFNGAAAISGGAYTPSVVVTFGATGMVVNGALSNAFTTTLTAVVTGAPTITVSSGQTVNWLLTQDATGGRTMTWPTLKWAGGSVGVLSTAANAVDLLTVTNFGGVLIASLVKGFA